MNQLIQKSKRAIKDSQLVPIYGKVVQVLGTVIRATIPNGKVGELCKLYSRHENKELLAEIIGFSNGEAILTPMGEMTGLSSDTYVIPTGKIHQVAVGDFLLGRILDGLGNPIDDKPFPDAKNLEYYPVYAPPPNPLTRKVIVDPLPMGCRAIDSTLTIGEGQRVGIFAAAGGGKSTLMGMLTKGAEVDIIVIALIGERGREVREFIEHTLGTEGLARSVLVVSTSDRPSMERAKAAYVATAIAEYFRDKNKKVLLLMDSVTRFARALREIGLAAGEPPTRRGFPPSVFATLPRLLERAGQSDKGSITGLYTILVEGDDMAEPIADETRSILDGHIILSRKLAAENHYPAIDVLASTSRVMTNIASQEHVLKAGKLRKLLAKYNEIELLVRVGEYKTGMDLEADEALQKIKAIKAFLQQTTKDLTPFANTLQMLLKTVG